MLTDAPFITIFCFDVNLLMPERNVVELNWDFIDTIIGPPDAIDILIQWPTAAWHMQLFIF